MEESLFDRLRKEADSLNACKKGLRNWPDTKQGLIERWKGNLDFAIERDFPSIGFIKDNFDTQLLHRNLIYVDEHLNIDDAPSGVYVINGECTGTIRFREWAAATLYVRHNSEISILAEGFAKVYVRLYDEATASTCDVEDSMIKVSDHR